MKSPTAQGPILVMVAASLWAVDALIRTPLTRSMTSASIVFYEHVIGLLVLSPILFRSFSFIRSLTVSAWLRVCVLSLVSSVGGTILFTQALSSSFATGDFITPLILQKLQPLFVIILAVLFLREKLQKKFLFWVPLAVLGSYLMSFGLTIPPLTLTGKELVVVLSLGASFFWGTGTILSKSLLKQYSYPQVTLLRFLAAIPIAFIVAINLGQFREPMLLNFDHIIRLFAISLSTGAVALLIYYAGLKKTNAHISTIAELMFPLVSILIGITSLNPYGAPQTLTPMQMVGIILLIGSVYAISKPSKQIKRVVTGFVNKGRGEGKKLGFPTINLKLDAPIDLQYGVYAGNVLVDKNQYHGIIHYGPRSTFQQTVPSFEMHLFNFNKNIYGKQVNVEIGAFIRETKKFSSIKKLIDQIKQDCIEAKRILHI